MTALIVTVFLASVLGSLHCAGMCGAFVLFAIGAGEPGVTVSKTRLMGAYHVGRLMTYVLLGAAAGGLGSVVDLAGPLTGIQHMAAIAAGALMVGFGVITWLRISGVKMSRIGLPKVLENAVNGSHQRAARLSPLGRALATGLLTTLLPCGWLYAFAITAAGTANVFSGALVMGTFWVGTLPALTALGAGIHKLSAPLARRVPMISAAAVIVVGLYTIAARSQVVLAAHAGHAATPASYETLMRRINALDEKALPCCTTQPEAK